MEPDGIHELTAAYALDALDESEQRDYEEHLRRCARCRDDLAELQQAASSLAFGAPAPAPPPGLRERILAQARAERPNVVPLVPRRRWVVPAAVSAAAAMAVVAVGLGIWASSLASDLDSERDARQGLERAAQVIAQEDAERFPLSGAEGTLVVAPTGEAALVLVGLDPAPAGKTYEIWVIEDKDPQPAGLFEPDSERTVVALERPVPSTAVVAVTLERDGGVSAPTGPPLFSTRTSA